jgi:hypothetical protein
MKNFFLLLVGLAVFIFGVMAVFAAMGLSQANPPNALSMANYVQVNGLTYEQSQSTLNLGYAQEAIDSGSAKKLDATGNLLGNVAVMVVSGGAILTVLLLVMGMKSTAETIRQLNGQ